MFRTVCGVVAFSLIALVVAGCGGGGGTSSSLDITRTIPTSLVATWSVPALGLPDDRLTVQPTGQVTVAATPIGTCSADGELSLNGSWSSSGQTYSISGSGAINSSSSSLSAQATVQRGEAVLYDNTQVIGTKVQADDLGTPPPPPDDDSSGEEQPFAPPLPPY